MFYFITFILQNSDKTYILLQQDGKRHSSFKHIHASSLHHLGDILFTSESYMNTDEPAPTRSQQFILSPIQAGVNVLSCSQRTLKNLFSQWQLLPACLMCASL